MLPWEGAESRHEPQARTPAWFSTGEPFEGKGASDVVVVLEPQPHEVGVFAVSYLQSLAFLCLSSSNGSFVYVWQRAQPACGDCIGVSSPEGGEGHALRDCSTLH